MSNPFFHNGLSKRIVEAHRMACEKGDASYIDPETGYRVFTSTTLAKRKNCCGCGCRHCPFAHRNVHDTPADADPRSMEAWLEVATGRLSQSNVAIDVLFWSGGKDAYLALRSLQSEGNRLVLLLTTFDRDQDHVAHQEVEIKTVVQQARALSLDLYLVPLVKGRVYLKQLGDALATLRKQYRIHRLVFGDLHLEHVRTWREDVLRHHPAIRGLKLHFPLWNRPYDELVDELEAAPGRCSISAVTHAECRSLCAVGDPFDRELFARFPQSVDRFGENGEFHTVMDFSDVGAQR